MVEVGLRVVREVLIAAGERVGGLTRKSMARTGEGGERMGFRISSRILMWVGWDW